MKVPAESFYQYTPEVCYLLGFLWADSYLVKNRYEIRLEIVKDDMEELIPIFATTGEWGISYRTRPNRRPQACAATGNLRLHKFFTSHGYLNKLDPFDCLDKIPEDLKHLWYRGYFDGDGCLYITKTTKHLSFASNYDQNWDFILALDSTFTINKVLKENSKSSTTRLAKKQNILNVLNYIYKDNLHLGLRRKYNKYLLLKR